jgi:hypothetical protein
MTWSQVEHATRLFWAMKRHEKKMMHCQEENRRAVAFLTPEEMQVYLRDTDVNNPPEEFADAVEP